jgi:hypothetical protein
MKQNLYLIKYYLGRVKSWLLYKIETGKKIDSNVSVKLNLGCGQMYLQGWVNVDLNPKLKPDLVCGFNEIHTHLPHESVDEILMLHSISYLRLWEARLFLRNMLNILKKNGILIMEFPDILKCSKMMQNANENLDEYLEGVRGIYAFDLDQIRRMESFTPYAFGWSAWHMKQELLSAGFKDIAIENPETHGKRILRDTRIIAKK